MTVLVRMCKKEGVAAARGRRAVRGSGDAVASSPAPDVRAQRVDFGESRKWKDESGPCCAG
jgi:hypothetical protein